MEGVFPILTYLSKPDIIIYLINIIIMLRSPQFVVYETIIIQISRRHRSSILSWVSYSGSCNIAFKTQCKTGKELHLPRKTFYKIQMIMITLDVYDYNLNDR